MLREFSTLGNRPGSMPAGSRMRDSTSGAERGTAYSFYHRLGHPG